MSDERMHEDEVMTDVPLVRRLLTAQFPQWAHLPIERVRSSGTDNAIYRLGKDLAVRLPRIESATRQAPFEYDWLPRLAPHLPIAVPEPVALGEPTEGYPWRWAVNRWLDGDNPADDDMSSPRFAVDLGRVVAAFRALDPAGARVGYRGVSLRTRDAYVREWTANAEGLIDTGAVLAAWDEALEVPEWDGPPMWAHGDLLPGNLLVRDGRLTGVIDFGTAGVGDPACDALAAWALLNAQTRPAFRAASGFDDASWARGRGWAITFIGGLTYYRDTNPVMAALGRRAIGEVLADRAARLGTDSISISR